MVDAKIYGLTAQIKDIFSPDGDPDMPVEVGLNTFGPVVLSCDWSYNKNTGEFSGQTMWLTS